MEKQSAKDWAQEQLASAEFGDVRREWRAATMLRRAAERPSGRLSEVFESGAELQAAYDFVEGSLAPEALTRAFAEASLRAATEETVRVVVDGTSLTLTDRAATKDFGSLGRRSLPTRGLKVVDALAVDHVGTPLGILDMQAWARAPKSTQSRFLRRAHGSNEVQQWVDVIDRISERVRAIAKRPLFIIDREGDCAELLRACSAHGGFFTIRAAQNRRLWAEGPKRASLFRAVRRKPVLGVRAITLPRRSGRPHRQVLLDVRVAEVVLSLPNRKLGARLRQPLRVFVVWAKERRPQSRQQPINWMLLTNVPVVGRDQAMQVLDAYCFRWRIEDFHRTWKSGRCRVEETQLRQRDHVVRWAIMLAAVAARVERLKHLARTQPNAPATIELTPLELQALRIKKRRIKKRTEPDPEPMPTIATAVLWIAQCGSYHGKTEKMPGAITIGRGLERLIPFVEGLKAGLELAKK